MISPSEKSLAEPSNLFLRSIIDSKPRDADSTAKIQKVMQDAHTLHKLAQAYDINQFLNESPGKSIIRETDLSAMACLARNISQALDDVVRSTSQRHASTSDSQTSSGHQRCAKKGLRKLTSRSPRSRFSITDGVEPVKRCHLCGVTETPRWRGTSSGTGFLCNVCDLVQTRRFIRKHLMLRRESTITRVSWP
jgi:hypothetical protein